MMMDSRQLAKYRFFRKLGAFPIDRGSRRGIMEALDYSASLLNRKERVWLFPQGRIMHQDQRPLDLRTGAAYILARSPKAAVVPVTVYYSMCGQKPDVSMWFGETVVEPWAAMKRKDITELLRFELQGQLDRHAGLVAEAGEEGPAAGESFRSIFNERRSTSDHFDRWRERLGRWKRFWEA